MQFSSQCVRRKRKGHLHGGPESGKLSSGHHQRWWTGAHSLSEPGRLPDRSYFWNHLFLVPVIMPVSKPYSAESVTRVPRSGLGQDSSGTEIHEALLPSLERTGTGHTAQPDVRAALARNDRTILAGRPSDGERRRGYAHDGRRRRDR